jgi:hypothetical protein
MKTIIDMLRRETFTVTIHDCGEDEVKFCLAVKIEEPVDMYFLGRLSVEMEELGCPSCTGELAYFPFLEVDAETYSLILAAP